MRVAVIGSGASGLTAIKTCKEGKFDVVCFERSDDIGGLWRYRDEDVEDLASVARSTIINTSKEITSYSDFPPPGEFSCYMHNSMMFKYLRMYADNFDLVPHIKFKHRVEKLEPNDDYEITGKWKVKVKNLKSGVESEDVFDGVMICTGHHVFPHIPIFPGQENFNGGITHTHSYKKPNRYEGKNVLVVGVGNSGGDAAVEVSVVAKKLYLSTRSGCWVMHRVGPKGRPIDETRLRRVSNILRKLLPFNVVCSIIEKELTNNFDHEAYQLKPKHRFLQQHPMVNDTLPNRILSGLITVKGNIKRFEENGVIFEGEKEVTEIDEVILGTGYEIRFPFLSQNILRTEGNRVELYKFVFPPHLKHPSLSIIGLIQIVGGLFPISEIQSRWFVELMKKNISLPTKSKMMEDIVKTTQNLRNRYYSSPRHTIQVDYIDYLDGISSFIGSKPNLFKLFFTDPTLFERLLFGPSLPYQYRLQGPHPWNLARKAIMDYENRIAAPLSTRVKNEQADTKCQMTQIAAYWKFSVLTVIFLALIVRYFGLF